MNQDAKIFVAGGHGLVGSAVVRRLAAGGFRNVVAPPRALLDLADQDAVFRFLERERPTHVFMCAAKVGGILANSELPADFIRDNLAVQLNVIEGSRRAGVGSLLFLGSSCVYPKFAEQPIREESLLGGALEPTNAPYAVAKIAGIAMCEAYKRQYGVNYFSVMPTNLYGIGDNFDLRTSHVLPALLRKFHEATVRGDRSVVVWGTGKALREFLYVDDLADACVFLMKHPPAENVINIGFGSDLSIRDLAIAIKELTGFSGELEFDRTKPDGTPRKLLDSSKLLAMGWRPQTSLYDGLRKTYDWFRAAGAPAAHSPGSSTAAPAREHAI